MKPVRVDIVEAVLQLSQCRSLDEIVEIIREKTRELIGADGITVVLRDGDQCFYVEENAVGPLWKGKRFPMSACISGWCMIHREQVAIQDIYVDARIPHDAYRPTFVKSLAMTPIRQADPIGAIGAYWATPHVATPDELRILQAIGDSAAMAFENAQLISALEDSGRRKDTFISMLAHELRNPLAPLRYSLHLLRMQCGQIDAVQKSADMMQRQVAHLSRMVDDLLNVARINHGKVALQKERLDLKSLVRQVIEDHRPLFVIADQQLELHVASESIWLDADATRLTQAIVNLLDNARKYTPAGGTISVLLRGDASAGVAVIEVKDSGAGIPSTLLPHIFESFTQADHSLDRTGGGLGLGLSVASGLIQLHDGTLEARSDGTNQGSCFTITLPNAEIIPMADSNRIHRVLIIEDNRDTALTLQQLLSVCGYETQIAHDGQAGVERAIADRPDCVLCDIGLPILDGYGVAETLRRSPEMSRVRLIAVTGYGSEEDRRRSALAGFDGHLVKPIDLDMLLQQMQSIPIAASSMN